jgi:hypothetical protein
MTLENGKLKLHSIELATKWVHMASEIFRFETKKKIYGSMMHVLVIHSHPK